MSNILLENYLASQFTFGFELEGIYHYDIENPPSSVFVSLVNNIAEAFNLDKNEVEKNVKNDISIHPKNNEKGGVRTFEWASPVFKFTPLELKKVVEGLDKLFKDKTITTNNTCGFHTHISFPDITDEDAIWIILKLAEMRTIMSKFKNISFTNEDYASDGFLKIINHQANNGSWNLVRNYLTTDKYRSVRIHPQGTLEWRGPRNFMNRYYKKRVFEFFKLLYQFISFISKSIASTEAYGTSKENIFKMIFGTDKKIEPGKLITNFNGKKTKNGVETAYQRFVEMDNVDGFVRLLNNNKTVGLSMVKRISAEYDSTSSQFLGKVIYKYYQEDNDQMIYDLIFTILSWGSIALTFSSSPWNNKDKENVLYKYINVTKGEYIRTTLISIINRVFDINVYTYNVKIASFINNSKEHLEIDPSILYKAVLDWMFDHHGIFFGAAKLITVPEFFNEQQIGFKMVAELNEALRCGVFSNIDNDRDEYLRELVTNDYNQSGGYYDIGFIINMIKLANENPVVTPILHEFTETAEKILAKEPKNSRFRLYKAIIDVFTKETK